MFVFFILKILDWITRPMRLASKNTLIFFKYSSYYWTRRHPHWLHPPQPHRVYQMQQAIQRQPNDIVHESTFKRRPSIRQQWPIIRPVHQHRLHSFKVCYKTITSKIIIIKHVLNANKLYMHDKVCTQRCIQNALRFYFCARRNTFLHRTNHLIHLVHFIANANYAICFSFAGFNHFS